MNLAQQCHLLGISRSGVYSTPRGESEENLALMREIRAVFEDKPFMDVRQMRAWLRLHGHTIGLKRVRRLMRQMHLMPIYQRPKTTVLHPEDKRYPYLLQGRKIIPFFNKNASLLLDGDEILIKSSHGVELHRLIVSLENIALFEGYEA